MAGEGSNGTVEVEEGRVVAEVGTLEALLLRVRVKEGGGEVRAGGAPAPRRT